MRPDEGFAMSSPLALMSAAAVGLAGLAFFVTDRDAPAPTTAATAGHEVAVEGAPAPVERTVTLKRLPVKKAPVQRGDVYVDVYNNSNITGLAGSTAGRIAGVGWQVVTSDNWYGTIPATTIYYPEPLEEAAMMLSKDLGIGRVVPAISPMSMDRLTVILTADYA